MTKNFKVGMTVLLDNEYGVVIKSLDREDVGLIRWDTPKKDDFEDWGGLFGSFISAGGKIINEEYYFKFINKDGSLKE